MTRVSFFSFKVDETAYTCIISPVGTPSNSFNSTFLVVRVQHFSALSLITVVTILNATI